MNSLVETGNIAVSTAPVAASKEKVSASYLYSLSGVRFIAIFHIVLYHLYSIYKLPLPAPLNRIFEDFNVFPQVLQNYFSHCWMVTSFFFLLSGFMMGFLYWGKDGTMTISPKRFLVLRLSRIFPIHLIVLAVLFVMGLNGVIYFGDKSFSHLALSFFATATLTQAWFPELVPVWSWPSWNLSALVFLYCITPWLMNRLSSLSKRTSLIMLCSTPFFALLPTLIFSGFRLQGFEYNQYWDIFLSSTPAFWVAQYVAGMLAARLAAVSDKPQDELDAKGWYLSFGDICIVIAIGIAMFGSIDTFDHRYFLRHGLMMPLYIPFLLDLARGRGIIARILSFPIFDKLGDISFSVFIWQAVFVYISFYMLTIDGNLAENQLWIILASLVVVSYLSAKYIEKPIQRWLRKRLLPSRSSAVA
ncbi:hypothetical protein TDB9533_03810 [Thalassocella blandensis]|nr:hypothetical protein TDB9533_03810 [Thalassocella blandensis]